MDENNTPKPSNLNIGEILSNLSKNDFSFHVTITSLIEILKEKKNSDGTPFLNNEMLNVKAKAVQEALAAQVKLSVPPPDSFTPPNHKGNSPVTPS